MKQITLLTALIFSVLSIKAQVKNPSTKKIDVLPLKDTTYTIQLRSTMDTIKVRIVAYGENNQILWFDGYAIRIFLIEVKTNKPVEDNPAQVRWYSKSWERINSWDIIQNLCKPLNWK